MKLLISSFEIQEQYKENYDHLEKLKQEMIEQTDFEFFEAYFIAYGIDIIDFEKIVKIDEKVAILKYIGCDKLYEYLEWKHKYLLQLLDKMVLLK